MDLTHQLKDRDTNEREKKQSRLLFPKGWRTRYYKDPSATPKHPYLDKSHKDTSKGLVKLPRN